MTPQPEPEATEPQAVQLPQESRREVVTRWLDEADRALSQDRLIEPADDNAHDRYRAALYLDPGNSRAQSGLHAIVLRYLDMARAAARRGAYAQSQELLRRANTVEPGSPLEIGRASCREREWISEVEGGLGNKKDQRRRRQAR